MENKQSYWIAVVSKDHTMRGVTGKFMQACHGKLAPLKRMKLNDWVIFYSPKLTMESDLKCQAFTAIGQVCDNNIYQFAMTENFFPYRRNIKFYDCHEIPILPLVTDLEFIQNKKSWGYPFRFGFFEIPEGDFTLIRKNMLKNGRENF